MCLLRTRCTLQNQTRWCSFLQSTENKQSRLSIRIQSCRFLQRTGYSQLWLDCLWSSCRYRPGIMCRSRDRSRCRRDLPGKRCIQRSPAPRRTLLDCKRHRQTRQRWGCRRLQHSSDMWQRTAFLCLCCTCPYYSSGTAPYRWWSMFQRRTLDTDLLTSCP